MKRLIQTFTGKSIDPLDPNINDIDIVDIAHSHSMMCRFNGHCHRFYSIAEHSINVSKLLPLEYRSKGLFHDGSEAYMSDIVSPAKKDPIFREYVEVEGHVQAKIYKYFNIPYADGSYSMVKAADSLMQHVEALLLFPVGSLIDNWDKDKLKNAEEFIIEHNYSLACHYPMSAKTLFLKEYKFLTS